MNRIDDTWKNLYLKLIKENTELKNKIEILESILHMYLPLIGDKK